MEDKPSKNEELLKVEEALPRLKERELGEKASRLCKAKTGVGCDGFHPQVPLSKSGKWPQQAYDDVLLDVTSERPIALMPTLVRWWEALRAPEVAKWQQKYRIDWDATDGRNGGAQRTVWENSVGHGEVQTLCRGSGRQRSGGGGPGFGSGEGLRARQSPCGVGLGDTLQRPEDLAGAVWVFRAPEAGAVCRMYSGAAPRIE